MKKRIFAVLLAVSILVVSVVLSGCGEQTAFNMVNDAIAKTDKLDSADAVIEMNIKMSTTGITMEMPVKMEMKASGLTGDSPIVRTITTMSIMGQETTMDMYQEGKTAYVTTGGMSFKSSIDELGEDSDATAQMNQILKSFPEEVLKDVEIITDEDGAKSVEILLTKEVFGELFDELANSVGEGANLGEDLTYDFSDMKVKIKVKDGYVVEYSVDFNMNTSMEVGEVIQEINTEASVVIKYNNPGQDVTVEAPAGYKEFPNMSDISA